MLLVLHTNDLFLVLKNITTERVPGIYIKRFGGYSLSRYSVFNGSRSFS